MYEDENGCTETIPVPIRVLTKPAAFTNLSADTICIGQTVEISSPNLGTGGVVTYTAEGSLGANLDGGFGAGPYTFSFDRPGDYTLGMSVNLDGICQGDVDTVFVHVTELSLIHI